MHAQTDQDDLKEERPSSEVMPLWSDGFDPALIDPQPLLVETILEFKEVYGQDKFRLEFFLPKHLQLIDDRLNPLYWESIEHVVTKFGGALSNRMEVHTIPIIPHCFKCTPE